MHSGKLLNHRELKISGDGEILVKGKTLFLGYLDGGKNIMTVDADGWFNSGDLGDMDTDGYLKIHGRRDNMFISGGENIYPEEIESELLLINGLKQALVVAIPDPEFGQRPVAFVMRDSKNRLDDQEIMQRLRKSLPKFKIPRTFLDWPEYSGDPVLKPSRAEFTALAEEYLVNFSRQNPTVSS
jgi:O-succinylbenzoic acid--CoA ligase